jgi:hypothetical protein
MYETPALAAIFSTFNARSLANERVLMPQWENNKNVQRTKKARE